MFLSGFAGISYEILYGRLLGDLLGDQFLVSAAVLVTFLAGIGVGALRAHRLWGRLWMIEGGIGLYALAFLAIRPSLDSLLYASALARGGLVASLVVGILLLVVPSFLIGCSLPLFAGYLEARAPGRSFARAYAIYNLGAAGTALGIEFLLVRWFGISWSLALMACGNLLVAAGLRSLGAPPKPGGDPEAGSEPEDGSPDPDPPESGEDTHPVPGGGEPAGFPVAALVALSLGSAVFQLALVELVELTLGPFRETFALVLSLVLLGIAGGSWAVRLRGWGFPALVAWNLAGLLLLLFGLETILEGYARVHPLVSGHVGMQTLKWVFMACLMGLASFGYGGALPALLREGGEVARDSGRLLCISSLANAAGFLLTALLLHPHLETGALLRVALGASVLALVLHQGTRPPHVLLGAALLSLVIGVHRQTWDEDLLYLGYPRFRSLEALRRARREYDTSERFRGPQDVFSILRRDGRAYLFFNGYLSMALDSPSEKIVGALSSLFAPRVDRALVLGVGSGATASTVGLVFEHTDAVEINPVLLRELPRFRPWNYHPETNPRVHLHQDDAVHFVKEPREPWSLILNTVTSPLYFSSSKLYTRDFFQRVKARLTPDGVYATWMDTRVGDAGGDIILRTLQESFAHCALLFVKETYFLLLASDRPLRAGPSSRLSQPRQLREDLGGVHGLRPDLLGYSLLTPEAWSLIGDPEAPVNTLDHPVLEFRMASLEAREFPALLGRLEQAQTLEGVARGLGDSLAFDPLDLLFVSQDMLGKGRITRTWRARVREALPDFGARLESARWRYLEDFPPGEGRVVALHRYAWELVGAGLHPRAREVLDRVLRLDPARPGALFQRGRCHHIEGNLEEARADYARARAQDPEDGEVAFRLGEVLFALKRLPEAAAQLREARDRGAPPESDLVLGIAEVLLGNREAGRAALLRAQAHFPDDPQIRDALRQLGGDR